MANSGEKLVAKLLGQVGNELSKFKLDQLLSLLDEKPESKRRRLLTTDDIQTGTDNTASLENAPASTDTKSQSQAETTTLKRTDKSKNDDEKSSKFEETLDNRKLPIPVDELWGFIHEMKLDADLAGDAFVFLLDRLAQLKGLISTPIGMRKSILLKMLNRDAK